MDRNRTLAGLDVHKDSIYLCIMGHDEVIIFEKTYGVLTPDLLQMCNDTMDRGVTEATMESTAVYPEKLVAMIHGRTVNKHGRETIKAAITGSFSGSDLIVFRQTKQVIDQIES